MNWPASQPAIAPMMTNQSKPMDSLSLSFCGGLRFRRSRLGVVRHLFGEQNDFLDDGRDAGEELRLHRGQPVDERLETTDVAEVVRQEVARLFAAWPRAFDSRSCLRICPYMPSCHALALPVRQRKHKSLPNWQIGRLSTQPFRSCAAGRRARSSNLARLGIRLFFTTTSGTS